MFMDTIYEQGDFLVFQGDGIRIVLFRIIHLFCYLFIFFTIQLFVYLLYNIFFPYCVGYFIYLFVLFVLYLFIFSMTLRSYLLRSLYALSFCLHTYLYST